MAPEKSHHHYAMMLRISEELACSIYYLTERSIFFLPSGLKKKIVSRHNNDRAVVQSDCIIVI